jgi:hypothetical protein
MTWHGVEKNWRLRKSAYRYCHCHCHCHCQRIFIALQISNSLGTGTVLNAVQIIEQRKQRISRESAVQKFWEITEVLAMALSTIATTA